MLCNQTPTSKSILKAVDIPVILVTNAYFCLCYERHTNYKLKKSTDSVLFVLLWLFVVFRFSFFLFIFNYKGTHVTSNSIYLMYALNVSDVVLIVGERWTNKCEYNLYKYFFILFLLFEGTGRSMVTRYTSKQVIKTNQTKTKTNLSKWRRNDPNGSRHS